MRDVPSHNPGRGKIVGEGKTKTLYTALGRGFEGVVIVEQKDTITKNNDPSQTRVIEGKGWSCTTFATQVFLLLTAAGIPNAFIRRTGDNDFLMHLCKMLGLEVVVRRLAMGSYFDRNPQMRPGEGEDAPRFHALVFELFLKTTEGRVPLLDGTTRDLGISDPERQDPYIVDPAAQIWRLVHPHRPLWDDESSLGEIEAGLVIGPDDLDTIRDLATKTFLLLEGALANVGSRLADFKLEFGYNVAGELVVADVIDPDSLRQSVWGGEGWIDLSKQSFRDGDSLEEVERKYENAALLAERIRIPRQAIITWTGSDKDVHPPVPSMWRVDHHEIVLSGHKNPEAAVAQLERLLAQYPDGGVIVVKVGMSNGLGPILAARTNWTVISVADYEHPEDVWSSLRMPSMVPNLTVLSEKNAILAALNVLAQKNPVVYMHRQGGIERLVAV